MVATGDFWRLRPVDAYMRMSESYRLHGGLCTMFPVTERGQGHFRGYRPEVAQWLSDNQRWWERVLQFIKTERRVEVSYPSLGESEQSSPEVESEDPPSTRTLSAVTKQEPDTKNEPDTKQEQDTQEAHRHSQRYKVLFLLRLHHDYGVASWPSSLQPTSHLSVEHKVLIALSVVGSLYREDLSELLGGASDLQLTATLEALVAEEKIQRTHPKFEPRIGYRILPAGRARLVHQFDRTDLQGPILGFAAGMVA